MMSPRVVAPVFREGEEVVLAEGTYQGTLGIFRALKEDTNWAEITERDGSIRCHPVAWLAHSRGWVQGSDDATGGIRSNRATKG